MQLRYNYRLYPPPGQCAALARAFGCARVVFNDALRLRQDSYAAGLPYVTDAEVSVWLTAAKKTPERGVRWSRDLPIPFDDEAEAIRLANDTEYGLAATAWTEDVRRALRMTKAIRAGTVGVNGHQREPNSPFGGYRQSWTGREGGRPAVESYTELKTVLLPLTDEMM